MEPFKPVFEEPSLSARRKGSEEAYSSSKECIQTAGRIRGQRDENIHVRSALELVQLLSSFSTTAKRERHFLVQIRPQSNNVYSQDEHSRTDSSPRYFLCISATPMLEL